MSLYKATATISFNFQYDGPPGQVKKKADEVIENLICETDEYQLTTMTQVTKLDLPPPVVALREYPVDKILALVPDDFTEHERRLFTVNKEKFAVKITSDRYRLFKKNRNCASCGIEGSRMFLEKHTSGDLQEEQAHFNLYGEEQGNLILMTKDHVKPKAFGGSNTLENYETLCSVCNGLKASYPIDYETVREMRRLYNKRDSMTRSQLKKALQLLRISKYECLNGQ